MEKCVLKLALWTSNSVRKRYYWSEFCIPHVYIDCPFCLIFISWADINRNILLLSQLTFLTGSLKQFFKTSTTTGPTQNCVCRRNWWKDKKQTNRRPWITKETIFFCFISLLFTLTLIYYSTHFLLLAKFTMVPKLLTDKNITFVFFTLFYRNFSILN